MSQLKAAIRDFVESVSWLKKAPEASEKVGKFVGWALLLLGIGAASVKEASLPWAGRFAPWLIAASAIYFTWHFAIAWHKNAGPIIWLGPPQYDDHYQCCDIPVENRGTGTVYARAYVQQLCDESDKPVPRFDEHQEVHFRGKCEGERAELYAGKHLRAVVLAAYAEDNFVVPSLWPPTPRPPEGPPKKTLVPLLAGSFKPLFEQKELRFTLRIDFCDDSGKAKVIRRQRYAIRPDPSSGMHYSLWPIR